MVINYISSKNIDQEHEIHSKSDNIEIKIYDKTDEVIKKHFVLHLNDIKLD